MLWNQQEWEEYKHYFWDLYFQNYGPQPTFASESPSI